MDADQISHEVVESPEIKAEIHRLFGDDVLAAAGHIHREAVARLVFADPSARVRLEQLVHPEVRARILERIRRFRGSQEPREALLVLDVSLLASSPLREFCDEIVFVDAPLDLRRRRARERGWTTDELARREAAQPSEERKRELAGHFIDNSGTLEQTRRQVDSLYQFLVRKQRSGGPAEGPPTDSRKRT